MKMFKLKNEIFVGKKEKKHKPQQSANALFHSKKKLKWLLQDLKNNYFIPRYVFEDIGYLNVKPKYLAIPMVCFCDVFLGNLSKHIKIYGRYIIGFKKSWGEENKLQKILYLNEDSIIDRTLKSTFSSALSSGNVSDGEKNMVLQFLKFIKPIWGIQDGKEIYYPDDSEWRFVPEFAENDFPDLLPFDIYNPSAVQNYNDVLNSESSPYKIKFTDDDIKYIIVPDKRSLNSLINFLKKEQREELLAKVLLWKDIKEDL